MLGELRVAGFSLFTVFTVLGRFSRRRVGGSGAWKISGHSKRKFFSHFGRAVTKKQRDVVRENKRKKRSVSDRLKFRKKI